MKNETKHYFLTSQSGRGFFNYFESELQHLNYVYVLKGVPGNGKSTLMRNIADYFEEKGYSIDMIHCSFDPTSLDGIILHDIEVGIVDGTMPHIIEPKTPFISGEYINIGEACDSEKLQKDQAEILRLQKNRDQSFDKYAQSISESLRLHDELEQFFIGSLNIDSANKLTNNMMQTIFGENNLNKESVIKHRLFDAITDEGNVDFVQDLTKNIGTRYFIKGRPGSGKSTLMKSLVAASQDRGYDIELYHCDFDPESLDMIIIPGLNVALFDSSEPHIYSPSREGDEIIDTSSTMNDSFTDDKYQEQIESATNAYEAEWDKAMFFNKEAKEAHQELEKRYSQAVYFDQIKEIEESLIKKLEGFNTLSYV